MPGNASLGQAVMELTADHRPYDRALQTTRSATQSWLSSMTAMTAGVLAAGVFSRLADGIMGIGRAAIGNNAYFQTMASGLEASFSDAAITASQQGAEIASAGAGAAAGAGRRIRDVNEQIQDSMQDHAQKLADIQADILDTATAGLAERQARLGEALTNLQESHASKVASLQEQLADLSARYLENQVDRAAAYQDQIANLAEQHADRQAALQEQLGGLTEDHEEKRAELIGEMRAKHSKRTVDLLLAGQLTERQIAAAGLTTVAKRLGDEDKAYQKRQADIQKRLAKEEEAYQEQVKRAEIRNAKAVADAERAHQRQLDSLTDRIDKENAAYDKQRGKLQIDADADLAALQGRNAQRLAELDKQLAQEDQRYARHLRDLNESLGDATQAATVAAAKPVQTAYSELGRMLGPDGIFAGLPEGEARVNAVMAFVRKTALELPGSVKDAMDATLMAANFNLDPTAWLKPAAAAAATFGKPVTEVMRGIGALASGRGGEAVEMLRSVGINIRNIAGMKFDAQGMLVTPLAEAMPLLQDYLTNRFGGALTKAQGTWANVTSNLGDLWDSFLTRMGGPLFERLNARLRDAMAWLQDPENEARINDLANAIGNGLGGAFDAVGQFVQAAWPAMQQAGAWLSKLWGMLSGGQQGSALTSLGADIQAALPGIVATFAQWGQAFIDWIAPMIPPLLSKLAELWWGIEQWIWQTGLDIAGKLPAWAEALWAWVEPMIPPLLDRLGKLTARLWTWVQEQVPVWLEQLALWGRQLGAGVEPMIPPLLIKLGDLAVKVLDWIGEQGPGIEKKLLEWAFAFSNWVLFDALPALLPKLWELYLGILNWIVTEGGPALGKAAFNLGVAMVQGIWDGLLGLDARLSTAFARAFEGLSVDVGIFHFTKDGLEIDMPGGKRAVINPVSPTGLLGLPSGFKDAPKAMPLGYALGGIVPGPIGIPQLAVVHGGEEIRPVGGGAESSIYVNMGGVTVTNREDIEILAYRVAQAINERRR